MLLELNRLTIPPGDRLLLKAVTWQEFEQILAELGEHRSTKLVYSQGILEIMAPLPEYEIAKEIISDLVKALLEELDIEFCPMGSTTFKNQQMLEGIEPDQCFYIQNEAAIRGKDRIDLTIDPPPDLALEIDITSRTHPETYAALGIKELWRFERGQLQINILVGDRYEVSPESQIFSGLPLPEVIPSYLQQSKTLGRNRAIKVCRAWVRTV